MTRVSDHYKLGRNQATLEFVDVDLENDVPLFIDPDAIRLLTTTTARECANLLVTGPHSALLHEPFRELTS